MPPKKYKKYLSNPGVAIPKTTAWRYRANKAVMPLKRLLIIIVLQRKENAGFIILIRKHQSQGKHCGIGRRQKQKMVRISLLCDDLLDAKNDKFYYFNIDTQSDENESDENESDEYVSDESADDEEEIDLNIDK